MKDYDESDLLDRLRRMAIDGEPPTCVEMNKAEGPSSGLYRSRFGSWNEAIKKAGLEPRRKYDYGKEEMLDYIRELADRDEPPTQAEAEKGDGPSSVTIRQNFGSWNEAVREAGFEPRPSTSAEEYTDEEILECIRDLAEDGEPPTMLEFKEDTSAPSDTPVKTRFGSWNEAVSQAGFDREPGERPSSPDFELEYSDEELFEWAESYIREFGELPGYKEVSNWPGPSYSCYMSRFGGLEETFKKMGIDLEKFETENRHYE